MRQKGGLKRVFVREINRIGSRPLYLFLLTILPLFTFLLFTAILAERVPSHLGIALYDSDNTSLSRQIVRMINASKTLKIQERLTDSAEFESALKRSGIYALVVIPKGLGLKVLRQEEAKIILYTNGVFQLPAALITGAIQKIITAISTSIKINYHLKKGQLYQTALSHSIPIKIDQHYLFNPYQNYLYYLETALLPLMLQIFILISAVYAFGSEIKNGTTMELYRCADESILKLIIGKYLPYTIIFVIMGIFMNVFLFGYVDIPLGGSFSLIIIATILFIIAYQAIGLFFIALTKKLPMALNLGAVFSVLALTLAGYTFPSHGMPEITVLLSNIFPYTHYLKIALEQGMRGTEVIYSLGNLGFLLLFCVLPFVVKGRIKAIIAEKRIP